MVMQNPSFYGVKYSNRDFTQAETWGKNQFNSSFPAGLVNFLASKNLQNVYIFLNQEFKIAHSRILTEKLYGMNPSSDDLFFSFKSQYTPYQQLVIGTLPRVDLVTQSRSSGQSLRPIEIKLTALPDNSTCHLSEEHYGCEIVIRPDTIVYLACSIARNFKDNHKQLVGLLGNEFDNINDWTDGASIWSYIPSMISTIDKIVLSILEKQEPILLQPIWKTNGKSPKLSENCLDVFVWSNFAFTQLFVDVARGELSENNKITR